MLPWVADGKPFAPGGTQREERVKRLSGRRGEGQFFDPERGEDSEEAQQ